MEAVGILAGLTLAAAVGYWYVVANRRLSRLVLGYDPATREDLREFLADAPGDTARMLQATWTPNTDRAIEHERVVMTRRLRIFVGVIPAFVTLPFLFDSAYRSVAFGRGGPFGSALALLIVAILVYHALRVGQVAYAYGSGLPLRLRQFAVTLAGVVAAALVLIGLAIIAT
jgi:hypothetical protein